jgi:hypothetical protein
LTQSGHQGFKIAALQLGFDPITFALALMCIALVVSVILFLMIDF